MDIPIYIGLGLVASGYFLNKDGKQERKKNQIATKKKNEQLDNKKSGGNNIYDSGYFQKVREIEDEKVITNFEKSFDPINTNIIPHFFNTLNETHIKRVKNPKYDKNLFKTELTKVMRTTPIQLTQLEPPSNDLTDVNQNAAVEVGGMDGTSPKGLYAETELNKGWSELVTRPSVDRDGNNRDGTQKPMTHNNMVPFFGGSARQNMDTDNRMLADKMETFTGQFKLDQNHKVEAQPMFAPVQQDLNQLLEPRELDRYVTSIQIRNNELPFEQIHVGPGLNDGYTAKPSGGYHNPLRILPKTGEQLLVNPRVVKEGRVIRGKDPVDQRTAQMKQYKYRPELLVTNFNGERNFTTVGSKVKPMSRSGVVQKPTERQKSKSIMGHASSQSGSRNTAAKLLSNGKISTKAIFKNTPFRNVAQAAGGKAHNNQQLRFENRPNERSTTQTKGYTYTNCKSDVNKPQRYQNDKAKKTRKQAYVTAKNPTGYVNIPVSKGAVYDPNYVTKSTIRQTTENNGHIGYIQADKVGGAVYDPNYATKTTIRQTTENNGHIGYVQADGVKGVVYDPNDITSTTIRQMTENNTHTGYIQADGVKGAVYDPNGKTKTTIRQTTENNDHLGNIQNNTQKGKAYDVNDLSRTTVRETTENNAHIGHVGPVGIQKGQTYDDKDVSKTTVKETTEANDHIGNVGQSAVLKGKVHDKNDISKTTIRQTTERSKYIGANHASNNNGQIVYDPKNVAKTTVKETTEKGDYVGVSGNSQNNKQIAYDPFDVATTTHRETTEDNDYLMPAESTQMQNGGGYKTAPTDNKNTQRQFYSDYYHVGGAGQAEAPANQQLYDSAYNMRQDNSKEVVAEGRYPTLSGAKVTQGKVGVNIEIKKLEDDRVNHYSSVRAPINCNQRKPMDVCELTSFKNNLPPTNTYFDPSVLKAYINNPLTQSLHSWA
jgi:hypothetical protein